MSAEQLRAVAFVVETIGEGLEQGREADDGDS